MKERWGQQQKQYVETLGDPWVVKQHHRNTGAKENHSWTPVSWETDIKYSGPDHVMNNFKSGAIIESLPQSTGV